VQTIGGHCVRRALARKKVIVTEAVAQSDFLIAAEKMRQLQNPQPVAIDRSGGDAAAANSDLVQESSPREFYPLEAPVQGDRVQGTPVGLNDGTAIGRHHRIGGLINAGF
jgi:hypothetical protein